MTDITPSIADAATAALLHARTAKEYAATAVDAADESATVAEDTVRNLIYGILPADPPLRPDGSPCQNGDQYYNETSAVLRMRVAGAWTTVAMSVSAGVLISAQNLNDVSSKEQSRINLGLGDAATKTVGAVNGVAGLDGSGKVPSSQLPTAGGVYLSAGANLSDIPDDAAARTNIGLGDAATKTVGAVNGVAGLDSGSKVPTAQLPAGTANGVASLDASAHVPKTQLWAGISNGMAELDSGGKVPVSQLPAFGNPVTIAKSADYTTISGDQGKVIFVTTGSSTDKNITFVGAATAGDGATMIVQKADSGTNKVIVKDSDGTTQIAWLSNQYDSVCFRSDGSTWSRYWSRIAPRVETFTANGTYTKPPLATWVNVSLYGAGGGGGGGITATSGTLFGGTGGGGGSRLDVLFRAAEISSTEAIVIGGPGTAGTASAAGGAGGNTTFGATVKASAGGGGGGSAGSTSVAGTFGGDGGSPWGFPASITLQASVGWQGAPGPATASGAAGLSSLYGGASSGLSSATVTAGAGGSSVYGGGAGGAGGGKTSASPVCAGGNGGNRGTITAGAGATGGATNGGAGFSGNALGMGGGGGGAVGGSGAGVGGAGGVAAGGGGGGAGGSGTAGAGGAGGRGEATITTMFA